MVIRRGEIWWAILPDPVGSAPGYTRPVLIVQSDSFNASRISTVVAVTITSNVQRAGSPGNVLLPRRASGLPKPSVANVSQVITIDRSLLQRRVRRLGSREFARVEDGLKLVLGLS